MVDFIILVGTVDYQAQALILLLCSQLRQGEGLTCINSTSDKADCASGVVAAAEFLPPFFTISLGIREATTDFAWVLCAQGDRQSTMQDLHHQSFPPKETNLVAAEMVCRAQTDSKQSISDSLASDPRKRPIQETLPQAHTVEASRGARHGLLNVSARYVSPQHAQDRGALASLIG